RQHLRHAVVLVDDRRAVAAHDGAAAGRGQGDGEADQVVGTKAVAVVIDAHRTGDLLGNLAVADRRCVQHPRQTDIRGLEGSGRGERIVVGDVVVGTGIFHTGRRGRVGRGGQAIVA